MNEKTGDIAQIYFAQKCIYIKLFQTRSKKLHNPHSSDFLSLEFIFYALFKNGCDLL